MAFFFGLFGGKAKTTHPAAVSGLQLQSSSYGAPVQLVYGTTRVAPNLLWYGDFQSHPVQSSSRHGKGGLGGGGGKGGGSTTSYTYTTAVAMGLCEGPIHGIGAVYQDKNVTNMAAVGLTTFLGGYSQSPWGYLTTNHPAEALNYRGVAYVATSSYQLGTSPQLPNHNFEVQGVYSTSLSGIGVVDADPSLVIADLLTNTHYGAGFPSSRVGDFSVYQEYTVATGLWVSPSYNQQSQISSILDDLALATNSAFVWSNGTLNLVPYGDANITANGYTYTAPSAPLYGFGDDDFLSNMQGSGGGVGTEGRDPVALFRKRSADQLNSLKIECLDRKNNYNPTVIEAKDQAMIDTFGLRQAPSKQAHLFADMNAARLSVQLQLQRQAISNKYQFTLDQRYVVLDPMDIVEISDSVLGITDQWVRILDVTENDDWTITITAEEYLNGTGNAPLYGFQENVGTNSPSDGDPGPTYFLATDVPTCLDNSVPAMWIVAAGPGGGFNAQKGTITFWYNPTGLRGVTPVYPTASYTNVFFSATSDSGFSTANGFEVRALWEQDISLAYIFRIEAFIYGRFAPNGQFPSPSGLLQCSLVIPSISYNAVPADPITVAVTWDGSGTTWTGSVFIDGVDVTDYTAQAAESNLTDESTSVTTYTTDMTVPLDGTVILQGKFKQYSTFYALGAVAPPPPGGDKSEDFELSQFWMLLGNAIDFNVAGNWSLFFYGAAAPYAPTDLGADGTLPTGRRPFMYFPHDALNLGVNEGMVGDISALTGGTINSATTIPTAGSYQAKGLQFTAAATVPSYLGDVQPLKVKNPETNAAFTWGSAQLWVSTDQGSSYTNVGKIVGPAPVGCALNELPISTDPDTVDTFSLDLGESLQPLPTVTQADADTFTSLCAIVGYPVSVGKPSVEFISYQTATLTDNNRYDLTYLRRGVYHSKIIDWNPGYLFSQYFASLTTNVFKFPYDRSLIGTTILFKFQASNGLGGGQQDLAELPNYAYTLVGPTVSLQSPPVLVVSEASSIVTLTWSPGQACALVGYDVGLALTPTYVTSDGDHGTITFWLDPLDPGTTGVGRIFSNIGLGATTQGTEIKIFYNQNALGAAHTGKYVVSIKTFTTQSSVDYILWTATTLQDISNGPVAVGISYDGTGTTWSAKILINGVDATDTAFQAANSSHGGTPGLAMGVVLDGTQVWDPTYAIWVGVSSIDFPPDPSIVYDNSAFGLSQLWLGIGHTLNLTVGGNWAKFFDGSNNPIYLGRQGEIPVSAVPLFYYPTDPAEPGHSGGQYGHLDFTHGGITPDGSGAFTATSMVVGNISAVGVNNSAHLPGFGYLQKKLNALTTTVTGLAAGTYIFQVRSVDTNGFNSSMNTNISDWTQTTFTVT